MIKISFLYPYSASGRFDHEYYRNEHMPQVKALLGPRCKSYSIDKGIPGPGDGGTPAYMAMSHVYCDSVEDFLVGIGPHAQALQADVFNFTDSPPIQVFSEVIVDRQE